MGRLIAAAAAAALLACAAGPAAARADDPRLVRADATLLDPTQPVAAPDGDVWFAEDGAGRLARVTPAGTLTEFPVLQTGGDDLRAEAVGVDGRVWFERRGAPRAGVLDPATGASDIVDPGVESTGALTTTADGATWFAGAGSAGAAVVRLARDGTRLAVPAGEVAVTYALGPAATPGAVVLLADSLTSVRASEIAASGAVTPITLPKDADLGPHATVVTGPAGTFIAANGELLRVDADHVARKVSGRAVADAPHPLAAGADGSLWLGADPSRATLRIGPDAKLTRLTPFTAAFREPATTGLGGIAVTTAGDAWLTVHQQGAPTRERVIRLRPSGRIEELDLGHPPSGSGTALGSGYADVQAGKLARGRIRTLRVKLRCSARCGIRAAVRDGFGVADDRVYATATVSMARAGTRTVALRRTRPAGRGSADDYRLEIRLTDRSGYTTANVGARGGGTLRVLRG